MQAIKVSLVFITFNNEGIIRKSICSFIKYLGNYIDEIIVFDNASSDRTVDEINTIKDSRIKVYRSDKNLGYRKALNILVYLTRNELVIVSNPDVYIIDSSLSRIINVMSSNKNIGIGCPISITQQKIMEKPILPCILYKIKSIDELKDSSEIIETQIGGGSIFIVRKSVFNEIGGLDENCFMYGEEMEISYKVLKHGYKIIWDTGAKVIHEYSYSTRRIKDKSLIDKLKFSFYCSFLNCYKYVYKNRNILYKIFFFTLYFLFVVVRAFYKRSLSDLKFGVIALKILRRK
ncbi:glycosyltransferase family 2 protein [Saccharolobus caldissimus]|uniref:Glycosyl transferase n=1 Tax=Saccharolobus caldissimus TaxID=1702097 RepID=A0AAQ4CVM9_9CREN|nr:glycosyltransferase family 2 protein [Saccharolobus caldissimus]BDB99860.1 glycosyl transferase [Saccharolobus caldissimus]